MLSGLLPSKRSRFIADQIAGTIEVLSYLEKGGLLYVAVDFSEIHGYAIPNYKATKDMFDVTLFKDRIALNYLFENYNARRYIYLLPPYADELNKTVWSNYAKIASPHRWPNNASIELTVMVQFIIDELRKYGMGSLLKTENIEYIKKDVIKKLIEFMESNYVRLYVALSSVNENSDRIMRGIQESNQVVKLTKDCSEIAKIKDIEKLENDATKNYLTKMCKVRRFSKDSNHSDALAYQYMIELNRIINPMNKAIILISRGGLIKGWPKLRPAKISIEHNNETFRFMIPLIFNPIAIYLYLINRVTTSEGAIDYRETIKRLMSILDIEESCYYSYENLKNRIDSALSEKAMKNLDNIASSRGSIDNLRTALNIKDERTRANMESYIKKAASITTENVKLYSVIFNNIIKLMYREDKELEKDIEVKIEKLDYSIKINQIDAIDLSLLEKIRNTDLRRPAPMRYAINEDDFITGGQIRELFRGLITARDEEEIEDILMKLYEAKKSIQPKNIKRSSIIEGWEAALLIAYFKLRVREKYSDESVLHDCEEAINYDRDERNNWTKLFVFLKNNVLFRTKENWRSALDAAAKLTERYGDEHPRYKLQYGYYLMRQYREGKKERETLHKAIKITEEAKQLTERKENRYLACYRRALANLINMYIESDEKEKAEKYMSELERSMDRREMGNEKNRENVEYLYTRTNYKIYEISKGMNNDNENTLESMKIKFSEVSGRIINASLYEKGRYEELNKKLEEWKSQV